MPDTVSGYNTDLKPVRLRPREGQGPAQGGRRRGHDAAVRVPDRGHAARTCRTRRRSTPRSRKDLEAVGIKVNVVSKPWNGGYLDDANADKYDAWLLGWTGDYNAAGQLHRHVLREPRPERLQHQGLPVGQDPVGGPEEGRRDRRRGGARAPPTRRSTSRSPRSTSPASRSATPRRPSWSAARSQGARPEPADGGDVRHRHGQTASDESGAAAPNRTAAQ